MDHLPWPPSNTPLNAVHECISLLCWEDTLLAHAQLAHQDPQILLYKAAFLNILVTGVVPPTNMLSTSPGWLMVVLLGKKKKKIAFIQNFFQKFELLFKGKKDLRIFMKKKKKKLAWWESQIFSKKQQKPYGLDGHGWHEQTRSVSLEGQKVHPPLSANKTSKVMEKWICFLTRGEH